MRLLALERAVPGVEDAAFTPELKRAEALRAWELYQAGQLRELYFRQDRPEAVLILECQDTAEARALLGSLPLVAHGLIDFEVIALTAYPGFARLFAPSDE